MTGPPARRAPRPSVCVVVGDEDERCRLGRRPITHRYSIVDIRRARRLDGKLFPTPWRARLDGEEEGGAEPRLRPQLFVGHFLCCQLSAKAPGLPCGCGGDGSMFFSRSSLSLTSTPHLGHLFGSGISTSSVPPSLPRETLADRSPARDRPR